MPRRLLVPALLLAAALSLPAQGKPIITVLDFTVGGVSAQEMRAVIGYLSSAIFATGKYNVIDVTKRDTLLKEVEFSLSACSDEACQLKVGKLLSAAMIVVGDITKLGTRYLLTARMLETETASTLGTATGRYTSLDELVDDLEAFGKRLAGVGGTAVVQPPAPPPALQPVAPQPVAPTLSGFPAISKTQSDPPFMLSPPTSNSQGAFSYTSSDPAVATVSGSIVSIVGPGTATITATQAASGGHAAASISAVLTVDKRPEPAVKTYKIGDRGPASGWVFYDKGTTSDGWRYLEAAPMDQTWFFGIPWNNGKYINIRTDTAVGAGKKNTDAIVAAQGSGSYAAKLCQDLVLGGFDDWFLPSADELNLMYENLKKAGLGGFSAIWHWSSSQDNGSNAWMQRCADGFRYNLSTSSNGSVRAVRGF